MKIAIACDHAGYPLKQTVLDILRKSGHEALDLGCEGELPVDYPDYARKLGQALLDHSAERGIMLCGSGVGASIALNKIQGVYAGLCHDTYSAHQCVEHDNVNVLCLGARVIGPEVAMELVKTFLAARFIGNDPGEDRHLRRTKKIQAIEHDRR